MFQITFLQRSEPEVDTMQNVLFALMFSTTYMNEKVNLKISGVRCVTFILLYTICKGDHL